jgi:hypothetical protein
MPEPSSLKPAAFPATFFRLGRPDCEPAPFTAGELQLRGGETGLNHVAEYGSGESLFLTEQRNLVGSEFHSVRIVVRIVPLVFFDSMFGDAHLIRLIGQAW